MLLAIQKSYELLANFGFFAREICDKCGIVLGAVRFTRHNESKVYCCRECRGDAQRSATHRWGRPRKYKTERERRTAKTRQQNVYRSHPSVEKTVRIQSETKKCLSRTWVLRDPENRSFRASERTWRSRQDSRCTPFRPNCWRGSPSGLVPERKMANHKDSP
jgi:hypothetical protein